jgi:hypothetical protein
MVRARERQRGARGSAARRRPAPAVQRRAARVDKLSRSDSMQTRQMPASERAPQQLRAGRCAQPSCVRRRAADLAARGASTQHGLESGQPLLWAGWLLGCLGAEVRDAALCCRRARVQQHRAFAHLPHRAGGGEAEAESRQPQRGRGIGVARARAASMHLAARQTLPLAGAPGVGPTRAGAGAGSCSCSSISGPHLPLSAATRLLSRLVAGGTLTPLGKQRDRRCRPQLTCPMRAAQKTEKGRNGHTLPPRTAAAARRARTRTSPSSERCVLRLCAERLPRCWLLELARAQRLSGQEARRQPVAACRVRCDLRESECRTPRPGAVTMRRERTKRMRGWPLTDDAAKSAGGGDSDACLRVAPTVWRAADARGARCSRDPLPRAAGGGDAAQPTPRRVDIAGKRRVAAPLDSAALASTSA